MTPLAVRMSADSFFKILTLLFPLGMGVGGRGGLEDGYIFLCYTTGNLPGWPRSYPMRARRKTMPI